MIGFSTIFKYAPECDVERIHRLPCVITADQRV